MESKTCKVVDTSYVRYRTDAGGLESRACHVWRNGRQDYFIQNTTVDRDGSSPKYNEFRLLQFATTSSSNYRLFSDLKEGVNASHHASASKDPAKELDCKRQLELQDGAVQKPSGKDSTASEAPLSEVLASSASSDNGVRAVETQPKPSTLISWITRSGGPSTLKKASRWISRKLLQNSNLAPSQSPPLHEQEWVVDERPMGEEKEDHENVQAVLMTDQLKKSLQQLSQESKEVGKFHDSPSSQLGEHLESYEGFQDVSVDSGLVRMFTDSTESETFWGMCGLPYPMVYPLHPSPLLPLRRLMLPGIRVRLSRKTTAAIERLEHLSRSIRFNELLFRLGLRRVRPDASFYSTTDESSRTPWECWGASEEW